MDQAQLQQFEQLIQALLSGDNNIRSQAEAAYNAAKANLDGLVSGLIYLLRRQETGEQIRSMSALLLRIEDAPTPTDHRAQTAAAMVSEVGESERLAS